MLDVQPTVEVTALVGLAGSLLLLAFKAGKVVRSNENLITAVMGLTDQLSSHVLESDTRDKANEDAHRDFRRCCDMQAEAIKGMNKRMDRVEAQSDLTDRRASELVTRVTVLEDRN